MTTAPTHAGVGASPGIAVGPVVAVRAVEIVVPDVADPSAALTSAMDRAQKHLSELSSHAAENGNQEAAEVLNAQSLMAEDPMLLDQVVEHLDAGKSLDDALSTASQELETMMASLPDPYLAARAADVGEVAQVVRRELAGVEHSTMQLDQPSVLVAAELTAAETADLDPALVLGFATETGGATSHVAIIARSLGVPAVVGASGLLDACEGASTIALDGSSGDLIIDPSDAELAVFAERAENQAKLTERLVSFSGSRVYFDGNPMVVSANIGNVDDVERAVATKADGVGLFRTEFLFLDRSTPPTEDEQYEAYRTAASSFDDTVVLRTFDIGGDKPAEFLDLAEEENPFLGVRGVRLYEQFDELFSAQIRAALRAAAHGDLAIMLPMVATAAEFRTARTRIDELRAELLSAGVEVGDPSIGVMVEVPSVALLSDVLAQDVDFFSIGTNDLTQYTMAADRGNSDLSALADAMHPAVIRLCAKTVEGALKANRSVSVCGLAAADPLSAAVFAAIGVNKLSVSSSAVNLIKATVAAQSGDLVAHVQKVLSSATSSAEVRERIGEVLVQP